MLPKERIAAVFEHEPTDRVPIYMGSFSSRVASAILGRPNACVGGGANHFYESCAWWEGDEAHAEFEARTFQDAMDLPEVLDLDYVRPAYWRLRERPTQRVDELTFLYGDPDGAFTVRRFDPETELFQIIDQQPRHEPTIEDVERRVAAMEKSLPDYRATEAIAADWQRAMAVHGESRAVNAGGVGVAIPREPAWLEAVALRPALVGRYLACGAERAARNAEVLGRLGARYAHGGGDFAGKHGPLYSPRAFHELMLPALQRISEACHRAGVYHMFASDGDLWPVADDLFGASGVDAFYEIETAAGMDLRRLREAFPHLTLLGGINSHTLHRGSADDVVRETLAALDAAHDLGSTIVGCSNLIVSQTPMANVWAMMETLWANR